MTKSKLNGQYQPEYEHDVKKEDVPCAGTSSFSMIAIYTYLF